ncbi:DUF4850 domain-containing protein [Trebonia kvetii]|uniref:DUF4850 domain-containing protein n=1 Tax=Trebonia kvetii TaxID=2480626 RepID=UPI0016528108|nr:DUF4850 domain-containing protein [Trebonia kvetii]
MGADEYVNSLAAWQTLSAAERVTLVEELHVAERRFTALGRSVFPSAGSIAVQAAISGPRSGPSRSAVLLAGRSNGAPGYVSEDFGATAFGARSFDYGKATYAGAAGMFFWTPCASVTSAQPGTSEVTICGGQATGVSVNMPAAGLTAVAVIVNGDGAALAAQPVIAAFTNHASRSAQVSVTGTAASVTATLRTDPISAVCSPASLLYSAPSPEKASAQLTDRSVITLTNCAGSLDALVAAGKVLKVISGVRTWLSFAHDAYDTVSNAREYVSSPALQACATGRMLSYIAEVLMPAGAPTCTPSTLPAWTGTLGAGQTVRFAVTPIIEEHFAGNGQGEAVMFSFVHLHVMACPSGGSCQAGTQLVTASLPVVACPTSLGINRPPVSLPRSRPVAVPRALAADLSLYADNQGVMELLGPKGWNCTAAIGADGSGGVTVYPRGAGPSSPAAITGSETGACFGCTLGQACALFPSAANALRSGVGEACLVHRPAAEMVMSIAAGIEGFEDPPGVKGDGRPSGGPYPANGVMTYHPNAQDGSWQETCTLPAREKDVCTAVLNTFVSWYGQR